MSYSNMAKLRVKGHSLPKHNMQLVFKELYEIERMINSGKDIGQQNYLTTRLVTIIEQFFREVKAFLLRRDPYKRPPMVELDTRLIDDVIKDAQSWERIFITERLIAQGFSFQNTTSIKEAMKKHGIDIFSENDKNLIKHEYDKFFDSRHSVVHSIERRPYLNVKKFYDMTEKLLNFTLEKIRYSSFYEDCKEAATEYQNGKADTYHVMAEKLKNQIEMKSKKANDAVNNERYHEAVRHYKEVLLLDPNDFSACISQGWAYFSLEKYHEAVEILERGLKLYDDPVMHAILGTAFQKLGDHEGAVVYFTKALEHEPDKSPIYDQLAISVASTGWPCEALKYAELALAENPNNNTALGIKKLTNDFLKSVNKDCSETDSIWH